MSEHATTTRGPLNRAYEPFGTTIFAEMSLLAQKHDALNLGQGFPDFPGPQFIKDAACQAIQADQNQYAPMAGVPSLVQGIAAKVKQFWGLEYDPTSEVSVYSGCTEAIHSTLAALCEPGDEVVVFEPYYDCYHAAVLMAGAVPRFVKLRPPEFRWEPAELEAALGPKTRLILFNTPQNPVGRVFGREEMEQIARVARERDLYVVSDEVYEHMVFEGEHVPMATLEGMRERTVTLNSTGKTFSMTGWKIGYSTAPAEITRALRTTHQFVTYATATPLQWAMAEAIRAPQSYYDKLVADYRSRRTRLREVLDRTGFEVYPCEGTYFQCAGIKPFGFDDDVAFCRHMIEKAGVVAIPPSAFYAQREPQPYVRFSFAKRLEVLDQAAERLGKLGA